MHPVAKLDHETDPPDTNSHRADSDAKIGCRVDRSGDDPDDASLTDETIGLSRPDATSTSAAIAHSGIGPVRLHMIIGAYRPLASGPLTASR